jgi:hypothetical protein
VNQKLKNYGTNTIEPGGLGQGRPSTSLRITTGNRKGVYIPLRVPAGDQYLCNGIWSGGISQKMKKGSSITTLYVNPQTLNARNGIALYKL